MRNGKSLKQRFTEHGFRTDDSDEATHDALDLLEVYADALRDLIGSGVVATQRCEEALARVRAPRKG